MVATLQTPTATDSPLEDEIPAWPVPWTHTHELAEDVIVGGLLCGDTCLLQAVREGYCFRGGLRARLARACLEWEASRGRFDDEEALARFLHARRALRNVEEANLALAMIAAYQAWRTT